MVGENGEDFESNATNFRGKQAYDDKPSTSNLPWSKFSSSSLISDKTVTNTKGKLVARAWRFGGSGISESATIDGVGIKNDETYKAVSSMEVSNTIVDPNASLTLESGGTITLKPGFHAKSGSDLNASIDPGLATATTEGVSSVAGSNPWQMELYSYNDEGRVKEKWIWTGDRREWDTHLAYEYNRLGDITKRMVAVGNDTLYQFYEYNQRGLLSKVFANNSDSKPSQEEVAYSYTATGAIDNIDYDGSKDADYAYTIRDWVDTINTMDNGNFAADYNYADNGNVDTVEYHNPQVQSGGGSATHEWDFGYDGLNRLTEADFGNDGTTGAFDVAGLDYDNAGNITDLQRRDETGSLIDNLTYNYSGNNRLQSIDDPEGDQTSWDADDVNSFGYDANGNLTSQSGKLDDVAYDHRNLPTQFALTSNDTLIANYNADGQRILKELRDGSWQFYVMDGQQTMAVISYEGQGQTSLHFNLVGNGTFGRYTDSGARRYYIKDHLGSTRAVFDQTGGEPLETFDYYPFGLRMPQRSGGTNTTMEKFTGHELDEELNLYHGGARSLDPALGRWLGVDPLADEYPSWSAYNYAKNNPMFYVDPTGRNPVCGDENNCDEVYREGAIVENELGRWEYQGGNEWKELEFNTTQSAGVLAGMFTSELDRKENSKFTQYEPSAGNVLKNEINSYSFLPRLAGNTIYDIVDAAYVSFLSFQRGNSRTNLAGEVVTGSRITESGVKALVSLFPYSKLLRVPGLNAAQFSKTFKGTFIPRLQPATRGVVNRKFNQHVYTKQNDFLIKGVYLSSDKIDNN